MSQTNFLRPRARLLRTLGEELISSEVVAVIELVKNAYDADATKVLIKFNPPLLRGKGSIEVIDNGNGMPLQTVQTVWMEPATPSKRRIERRTDRFNRRYLGEKGIGRFASSRLADELEVISRARGSNVEVYGVFDWRQFDDESKYLDEIIVLWEERAPIEMTAGGVLNLLWATDDQPNHRAVHGVDHGTMLRMRGLKQEWTSQHFHDLRRSLARLVSPSVSKKRATEGDPGFEVEFRLPEEFGEFSSKVEAPAILKHPHYTIKGRVHKNGEFSLTYRILAEGIERRFTGTYRRVADPNGALELRAIESDATTDPTEKNTPHCGPLDLELRVWDRDELGNVVQKTHSTLQDIRRDLDAVAGVNIYRDGFRVLPYGEPQDDWLRLDLRRLQNPTLRLSNNQIYGVVGIKADENPELRDQSNREGLDENQALQDLRTILLDVLSRLETLRYSARPRATPQSKRAVGGLFSGFDIKPLADFVASRLPEDKQAKEVIQQVEQSLGGQLKDIQTVLSRYQRLATLGQLIDHVLHEGRQPIAAINNEASLGLDDVQRGDCTGPDFVRKAGGRFSIIRKQGDVLAIAFRRMEPFGGRRRGRPAQLYLENIIRDALDVFADDIARLKVKVTVTRSETLVRVDPAEMQEVIINLTQNSLYWLQQESEGNRAIAIKIERKSPEEVNVTFSDSGPGVSKDNREMIFEPYFSTRPEGVGLGLAIVGEIVSDYYNGSLQLLESGPLKGANFLVTLRKRV